MTHGRIHGICPPTTVCHNTLLATQPKVDDNGTPPFRRPLLLAPSKYDKYYKLLPPLKIKVQVRMSKSQNLTHIIGYWRSANHPGLVAEHVAP